MSKRKSNDENMLDTYDRGEWESVSPQKSELRKFKDAAKATLLKDRRVNVRLSSPDLLDIQARAVEEGIPYQTLIASVLHKFVSGRLEDKPSRLAIRAYARAKKQRVA